MNNVTEIRANVYFPTFAEGGRRHPIFSGYRPHFHFGSDAMGYDAVITLEGRDRVPPGEACAVRVRFLHPEWLQDVLRPGTAFEVREGLRVVGRGTILETAGEAASPVPAGASSGNR
jgi:elongation factor Tu